MSGIRVGHLAMHVLQAQADLHKLEQNIVFLQELAITIFDKGVQIAFLQRQRQGHVALQLQT